MLLRLGEWRFHDVEDLGMTPWCKGGNGKEEIDWELEKSGFVCVTSLSLEKANRGREAKSHNRSLRYAGVKGVQL